MAVQSVSTILNLSDGQKSVLLNPQTDLVLVQVGDIGADYVVGSEGKVKTITEYRDVAKTELLSVTTLKYQDTTYPTTPTSITTV